MRKGIVEGRGSMTPFDTKALEELQTRGYLFVQVKGLTRDNHYDYIEPNELVLIPLRSLPADPAKKDIYDAIDSDLLRSWAADGGSGIRVYV